MTLTLTQAHALKTKTSASATNKSNHFVTKKTTATKEQFDNMCLNKMKAVKVKQAHTLKMQTATTEKN